MGAAPRRSPSIGSRSVTAHARTRSTFRQSERRWKRKGASNFWILAEKPHQTMDEAWVVQMALPQAASRHPPLYRFASGRVQRCSGERELLPGDDPALASSMLLFCFYAGNAAEGV